MSAVQSVKVDFTIGSRRLFAVARNLSTWSFTLEQALPVSQEFSPPETGPDGLRVLSAPSVAVESIAALFPEHLIGGRQDYARHYIDMAGSFADYLDQFSSKTRSTLRRKARKLAKAANGEYHVSEHRNPTEMERFLDAAIPLSAKTYQARLLDAGLPDSAQARSAILEAAEDDRMRGFLLHVGSGPIAYLSLPVSGNTLIYAHLGYDPDWARLSAGTVLQMEALERLFAERRYRYFDFTEGDGAHKAMFGSHSAACSSFLLLKPTIGNRALLSARAGFDASVAHAKALATRSGALARVRSALRA